MEHAGEEGRRRRCRTGGPRQTRRERGPFRAAVEMQEVLDRADDARQSALGAAIIASMPRALAILGLIATTLASARRRCGSRRFRPRGLGDRRRHVPARKRRADQNRGDRCPETHRDQAKCSGEIVLGLRTKDRATALLAGREVTFHRVGRSYNRTVATVVVDGRDLGTELVRLGVAAWWPRGRPKPIWCDRAR